MKKLIVILAAIAMVGAFTATAMADVSLYGSARFRTYVQDVDPGTPGSSTDTDTEWRMGHLSRFGANFKSDKVTGKVEIDARAGAFKQAGATSDSLYVSAGTQSIEEGSGASGLGNVRLRHLWGQYDFGAFKLMIGQNYPLYDAPVSGINYYSGGFQLKGGIGYTVARTSQLRLTFGNLRIAFLTPDTSYAITAGAGLTDTISDVDTTLPKIEVRYDMKFDPITLNLIGGWQSVDMEGNFGGTALDESIDSYVLGARGKANFGPLYVGLSLTYRQNGTPYGAWTSGKKEVPTIDSVSGSFEDGTAFGMVAAVGFKVNDMFTIEGSYSMLNTEQDTVLDNEDDLTTFGLMAKITVAPGVYIIPEFIFQDDDDRITDGVKSEQGDTTIYGVFWRIDFK